MLLRFMYLLASAFMLAVVVYFGDPDRAAMLNYFERTDPETSLTGALTSLLCLVALSPFFFLGFWKGWKLGALFLALAVFAPGMIALHGVKSAERAYQAEDVGPVTTDLPIVRVDLVDGNRTPVRCRQVCATLLRREIVESVRLLANDDAPATTFILGTDGRPTIAPRDAPGDVTVQLAEVSDTLVGADWPEWVGGFAAPKALTRLTIRRGAEATSVTGELLLRGTALAYDIADTPTWLHPPRNGFNVGDLRRSIEVAKRAEWHSAVTPDAVIEALISLGAGEETVVADAR